MNVTQPRYAYRPWSEPSQVNPNRIAASDRTPTLAVQGEDRKGIENTNALHRHLSDVLGGSPGSWTQQSSDRWVKRPRR